jgi:hypothetical protein
LPIWRRCDRASGNHGCIAANELAFAVSQFAVSLAWYILLGGIVIAMAVATLVAKRVKDE